MRKLRLVILMAFMLLNASLLRADIGISATQSSGAFPLYTTNAKAIVVYDAEDAPVVATAAGMLNSDIQAVTGGQLTLQTTRPDSDYLLIAGTVDSSKYISELAEAGKIDVSELEGKWESYSIQLVESPYEGVKSAVVVCGSTPRGTAYGLLELSRLMGVSPYIWWADVKPKHQSELYVSGDKRLVGEPSVQYRGIFINDEDWGILPWARNGIDKEYNNMGPNTYEKVAALLLRLKANTLWPAIHGATQAFWTLSGNLDVARRYGIVMGGGTMLRDNLWEWVRYGQHSDTYNYATNKDVMLKYWAERVGQSRGYEAIYNISTRGFQDEPLLGYSSTEDAVAGVTDMITNQRKILQDSIGDPTTIPQLYMPYKEALDIYNAGLEVPEDVTLCWVDDNFGYIRQLPTEEEQQRKGGNGVYYHLSYLGTPAPYLWISSMSPSFLSYELTKGYDNGIRKFWMFNVGDIKPAEEELQFCMDLAWDVNAWKPQDAYKYTKHWATETFGEDVADEISSIKNEYYALAQACKPELINRMDYTNEEYNARVARYEKLIKQVDDLKGKISSDNQDAFFELIEYPVKGAANMNIKILRAKQGWNYAAAGLRDTTLAFATSSLNAYREIRTSTDKFNNEIAGGKWNGIMQYKPYGGSVFDMPTVASLDDVFPVKEQMENPSRSYYLAKDYTNSRGNLTVIENMGVAGSSVAVMPWDMTEYTSATYTTAPFMEYTAHVKKGMNHVVVRCLPNFPINTSYDLRVGVVLNHKSLQIKSIKMKAMSGKWNTTVAQGFADATLPYESDADEDITVRIYFMDPGLAVSDFYVESEGERDDDLTNELLVNPDFELNVNGEHSSSRGLPYGWKMNEVPTGGSYGVNADAENPHNDYCCWVIARPFPDDFMLYQTIPASKLQPGVYKVSCILWNQNGISGNCRLFANHNVQYFASPDGVSSILTEGETNWYASHQGTTTSDATMQPMAVYVIVNEGDSLQLGIRTSNRKSDGSTATGNDPTGWFKVDDFRIIRVGDVPENINERDTLTAKLIVNNDFEYRKDGKLNVPPNTGRGVPYGWSINCTFPGSSYGVNQDAENLHANNVCWFQNQLGKPMPSNFELSQTISADKLEAGRYLVRCMLYVQDGLLGTCRLFANDQVQYFGTASDYQQNLTEGEQNHFAGYFGGEGNNYVLRNMYVYVDVQEGEDLKIGIRSGNQKSDGTYATGGDKTGWFKVDYFTIERADVVTGINVPQVFESPSSSGVYNLSGQKISNDASSLDRLPKGLYIVNGKKVVIR